VSVGQELRVVVEGPSDLVLDLDPAALQPAGDPAVVVAAPATDLDRRLGRRRFEVRVAGWTFAATAEPAERARLRERAARDHGHARSSEIATVRAQLPGRVVRVWVTPGDAVESGQRLLAIEAMKMENEVRAPRAGTVERVAAASGSSVELGDELVTIR
jgi:biotin carboxyl carrier protein